MACYFNTCNFRGHFILIIFKRKKHYLIGLFFLRTALLFILIFLSTFFTTNHVVGKSTCGNTFENFLTKLKEEAVSKGHDIGTVDKFFAQATLDPKVLKADRSQTIFRKMRKIHVKRHLCKLATQLGNCGFKGAPTSITAGSFAGRACNGAL